MKVKQRDKHEEFVTRLRSSDMDRKLIKSQEMGFFWWGWRSRFECEVWRRRSMHTLDYSTVLLCTRYGVLSPTWAWFMPSYKVNYVMINWQLRTVSEGMPDPSTQLNQVGMLTAKKPEQDFSPPCALLLGNDFSLSPFIFAFARFMFWFFPTHRATEKKEKIKTSEDISKENYFSWMRSAWLVFLGGLW